MYLQFFGLSEAPFSITPDPAFVYLSPEHRDALAHLLYGVGQGGAGGFVQLTGEVGTGKTTMCRCLLEQVPENTRVALVLNPLLTPAELLATICEELGLDTEGIENSNKAMVDALNACLLDQHAKGRRVVVVIDEAQNLSPEALEQVRLLTNLETAKDKLLQMVLLGQPELRRLLQRTDLRQLAQRITARYHLEPLNREETFAYVRHRMMVAGANRSPFTRSALKVLHRRSGGVPRLINIIADRALAGAYAAESSRVTPRIVNRAADEVQPGEDRIRRNPWPGIALAAAALLVVAVAFTAWKSGPFERGVESASSDEGSSIAEPAVEVMAVEQSGEPRVEDTREDQLVGTSPALPAADELDDDWLDVQNGRAWRALSEAWGKGSRSGALRSACDGIAGTGFACLHDAGSWFRIRQLGLPVLLKLHGEVPRLLLLRGFADDRVLVGQSEDGREVKRGDIEQHWLGEFVVAWPQAPDWPVQIRRGDTGPAVDIVMQMAVLSDPPWQGSGQFDEAFEEWLVSFQRNRGLDPDGIIGPNTLIHLMSPTIDEPRLLSNASGEGR